MKTNKPLIYTLDFAEIGIKDISRVGGKNASLGELFNALKSQGVGVIDGSTAGVACGSERGAAACMSRASEIVVHMTGVVATAARSPSAAHCR